jgi:Na+-translocating ferredoxin:NAD+ oxidoreductase RnfC subunit
MKLEELQKLIQAAGVVGAGGAGFPTHAKLNQKIEVLILNCAECEPLLRVDRQLLGKFTTEILSTLSIIAECLDCNGIVAIKGSYEEAIEAVKNKIKKYDNLELKILPEVYPAGDEVVLIYEATGKIVPEGAIPVTVGTAVLNVETVLNIYNFLDGEAPVTDKYITVAGEVNNPITVKVPVGISTAEAIKLAGGTKLKRYKIIMGGPMTGKLVNIYSPITKTTKAVIVLPQDHPVILKKTVNVSTGLKRAMSVCSQCQMCTDLCPRNLLGHSIRPHRVMNGLACGTISGASDYTTAMLCCECGLCEMYSCHQGLSPRALISTLKDGLKRKGVKNPHNVAPQSVNGMREGRMVPMERLIHRLGLACYDREAELSDIECKPQSVTLPLLQHIGAASLPVVKKGEYVEKGQLIAKATEGKLGANIHASLEGIVKSIDEEAIVIAAN